jgi:hypothetical protein
VARLSLMRGPLLLLVLAMAVSSPGRTATANLPCTAGTLRAVRKDAQKLVKAGRFQDAIKMYESVTDRCAPTPTQEDGSADEDYFWLMSDHAFALLKAGRAVACRQLLQEADDPDHGIETLGVDDAKVGKAIRHNQAECMKAFDRAMSDFAARRCPLPGASGGVAVPEAAVRLAGASCLSLEPPRSRRKPADASDPAVDCPRVALISAAPGGKPAKKTLAIRDGHLAEISDCCNIDKIETAVRDGKLVVRVRSSDVGFDCQGGTAATQLDEIYAFDPATRSLARVEDLSISIR